MPLLCAHSPGSGDGAHRASPACSAPIPRDHRPRYARARTRERFQGHTHIGLVAHLLPAWAIHRSVRAMNDGRLAVMQEQGATLVRFLGAGATRWWGRVGGQTQFDGLGVGASI